MSKPKVMERIESLFKEEVWGRIEPKDIGISRFKILDDIFNVLVSENIITDALDACEKHLEEHADSVTAMYLTGICGYHIDNIEYSLQLRKLLDIFISAHKWAVIERIAEKILEYGESSFALRALALSLERLGRQKEAIPILENLLKIDRFDAQLAKKLAFSIIDDDVEKSSYYLKLSIEGFIKNKEFDEVSALWNKLMTLSWDDITFIERIERLLVEAKQHELVAMLLKSLLHKYRDEENPDRSINLLKKILLYRSDDTHARRDLVNLYKIKYADHSQFDQFLRLSKLNNFKAPVKYAIEDFEKNIVFDTGNYVYHNSWGLGKITDISNEAIVINFKGKPDHKMSIQMALQSLTPINDDHFYVMEHEDAETLNGFFKNDFISFFEILIKSYGGKITLADIKNELIPKYVDAKGWTKWWSKARTAIKKDPIYGVSDKKKDLIYLRDKPLNLADELLANFTKTESFSSKLDITTDFINNTDASQGTSVVSYFIDYFTEQFKGDSATRQVLSYFILKDLVKYDESSKIKLDTIRSKIIDYIKTSDDLSIISMKISSYDYKKDFVNLIHETRENWQSVLFEMLFETPVRIHKYIFNILIRAHSYNTINSFIDRTITGAKQFPEIFIWVAKNLFNKIWDYDWLDYSMERLTISYFRLFNELKKIEIDGNRLKNMLVDILFDNDAVVLKDLVATFEKPFLRKLYDLCSNVSYVAESDNELFFTLIKEKYSDFQSEEELSEVDWDTEVEKMIVSQEGYELMQKELDRLVNDEMVKISKELSKVSEASPDVRENVEYNALMEKQAILEMSISKLDNEMKKADILDVSQISVDAINIGTKINLKDDSSGDQLEYTILGPWDADFEKKILSYRSPIAKNIIGRKIGERVKLRVEDEERQFTIASIQPYNI